jgi:hypothetical protein
VEDRVAIALRRKDGWGVRAIATRLNGWPRKTLGFATPDEVFAKLVEKDWPIPFRHEMRRVFVTELESAYSTFSRCGTSGITCP